MTDLITRLRTWSHARHAAPASDLMDEAAAEIERLKSAENSAPILRTGCGECLTDAERKAVTEASEFYTATCTGLALSGLLERLGGGA